jgi:hypothetical protein
MKKFLLIIFIVALSATLTGCGKFVPRQIAGEGDTNFTNVVASGNITAGGYLSSGGEKDLWTEGTCNDASTTLFSIVNPWTAGAYVDKLILYIDVGATSSADITCGTTTSETGLAADPSDLLIDDYLLATSTAGTATTTVTLMNGLAGAARSTTGGFGAPGTNSEDIIYLRSTERVACYADNTALDANASTAGGFTGNNNQFNCYYKIHSIKQAN